MTTLLLLLALPAHAQTVRAQSTSTVSLANGTLEIHNVSYEVAGDERLLLRQAVASKQILGDKGQEASLTLDAWPLGTDTKQKPRYTIKVSGTGGRTLDNALFIADRGLEEVDWWSVYRLATGQHLLDTYVPLVSFSISKNTVETRYIGLEVPPDDASDPRLRKPEVVAVITYASAQQVKRELLLTCDDPKQAALLRSYSDTTRTVSLSDERPARTLKIAFHSNDASPPPPPILTLPLAKDDLDFAHAQLSAHLHLTSWKR